MVGTQDILCDWWLHSYTPPLYFHLQKREGGKHGNSSLITSVRPSFDLMKPECGSLEEWSEMAIGEVQCLKTGNVLLYVLLCDLGQAPLVWILGGI